MDPQKLFLYGDAYYMLKRNVYLLYPAGFSGSYVNWAISASDIDQSRITTLNPLNNIDSRQFGGIGTSHGHVRIPTHQTIFQHLTWVLANRPTDYRIYIINVAGDVSNREKGDTEFAASMILRYDPDGVIINIHDNNDSIIKAYGEINCTTKWPTYLSIRFKNSGITGHDPFNCNTLGFRNFAVKTPTLFHRGHPMDFSVLEALIDKEVSWYKERGRLQPHEVNSITYPHLEKLATLDVRSKVFELSCYDVVTDYFIDILNHILYNSDISDNYDTSYVKNYHPNYVQAQQNLQWFESFRNWKDTGSIDDYLCSHSIIQAQILKEMFSHIDDRTLVRELVGWEDKSLDEINNIFQQFK